jgi:hypothetical protein
MNCIFPRVFIRDPLNQSLTENRTNLLINAAFRRLTLHFVQLTRTTLDKDEGDRMFELMADEKVIDSVGPLLEDRRLKTCSECPQVAFRILRLKSTNNVRDVGLCGAHFTQACAMYPHLRRAVSLRTAV